MKRLFVILILGFILAGCTEQIRAKSYGMTATTSVSAKVVMATWKNNDLWIMTRPPRLGEYPETYTLAESSSWGILEGQVIIKETFVAK